jgi:hypothetical protein
MDTALFYPTRLNLSEPQAWQRLKPLFENASRYGGTVTINWHERSIAPERLWGDFYCRILEDLTRRRAWFSTAGQAVSWFRKRRAVVFENSGSRVRAVVADEAAGEDLPGLRLRQWGPAGFRDTSLTSSNVPLTEGDGARNARAGGRASYQLDV